MKIMKSIRNIKDLEKSHHKKDWLSTKIMIKSSVTLNLTFVNSYFFIYTELFSFHHINTITDETIKK